MGGESTARRRRVSSENIGTSVPRNFPALRRNKFGTVVRALWPHKPALNLAQRAGLSQRGAQLIIDGHRKPNARVAAVVHVEMLDD